MASKNVETFKAAHEAFNKRDFGGLVKEFAPSITYVDHSQGVTCRTPQEFKDGFLTGWITTFSDARITEPRYIDGGETVVARFTARGRQDGALGPFPAGGKEMALPFCEMLHFDSNGRVVGGEIYYDQLSMLRQLGLMPEPVAA
jgi:SnoaL-like polyketide cyclase